MKNFKKVVVMFLVIALSAMISLATFAADEINAQVNTDNVTVINIFDPNDPHLVAIVDLSTEASTRTTSRPTSHYDLASQGQYQYSAYSNNNVMWSKYVFDTSNGKLRVYGTANSTKDYRVIFHNSDNGKDYYYSPTSTTGFDRYDYQIAKDFSPSSFYFGIDTTISKSAVSIDGFVDTY